MRPIRLLLVLLLGNLPFILLAQTQVDSLTALSQASIKNEAWVDAMILNVGSIVKSEPKTALEFSNTILKTADSIVYKLGTQKATLQHADILNVLGNYSDAKKRLEGFFKTYNKKGEEKARALTLLGIINFNLGKYDEALKSYDDAEHITGNNKISTEYGHICVGKGDVYSLQGDYVLAIDHYLQAEEIYKRNNQNVELAIVYNALGIENRNLQLHEKAIDYYQRAVAINLDINDLENLSKNYSNLGVSFQDIGEIDKAVENYKKSLELAERIGSSSTIAQNSLNLGTIYLKNKNLKKAIRLFRKSLHICRTNKITYGMVLNYINIGSVYTDMKKYDSAIINLDSSLKYAKKVGLPKEESQIYEHLSHVYKQKNDFKNAFHYQSLFKLINDSLITIEKQQKIIALEDKYTISQEEKTILEMQTKAVSQKLTIVSLILVALSLLLIAFWFVFKHKKEVQKKKLALLTADKMALEIKVKNSELNQKTLNIAHLKENNKEVTKGIEALLESSPGASNEMKALLRKAKLSAKKDNIWQEFDLRFKANHSGFYTKIMAEYPDLSPVEVRIVALLRLNLTSKEIAEIMQRSTKTIENNRGNIRKKMNLQRSENLTSFILAI